MSFNNRNVSFDVETIVTNKSDCFGLRLLYLDSTIAISSSLNEFQLPNIKYEDPCMSLESDNEKALLVRNSNGDYAIIKASIYYFPNSILKIYWFSFGKWVYFYF